MAVLRQARSVPGTRYQLSLCSTEELKTMLQTAFDAADQIVAFVELAQTELVKRGETIPDPYSVA